MGSVGGFAQARILRAAQARRRAILQATLPTRTLTRIHVFEALVDLVWLVESVAAQRSLPTIEIPKDLLIENLLIKRRK